MEEQPQLMMEFEVIVDTEGLLPIAATTCFVSMLPNGTMSFDFGYTRPEDIVGAMAELQRQAAEGLSPTRFQMRAPGVARIVMTHLEAEQFVRSVVALFEKNSGLKAAQRPLVEVQNDK